MFTQRKLPKIVLLTLMGLELLPGSAMAYTINFLGADAGNTMASTPSNNNFVQSGNGLRANGTTWGPPTQTLGGGSWSGFQTNRSVTVENLLNVYSGYSYTSTSFTAGAGGQINPGVVHTFNLHNELYNWSGCCGLSSQSRGDVTFRFNIPDAPGPIHDGTGALVNSPVPIYFVYEWIAEAISGSHAWNTGSTYTARGAAPGVSGDFGWTEPQLPHYANMDTVGGRVISGSRAGVFYSWTGGDYNFVFANNVGGMGIWGPSVMDFNIRLAFSDQPFTSIPSAPVPEPETYAMLLAGLGLLGFTARRKKNRAA